MLEIIAILSILAGVGILLALSWIDLREGLLPNEFVLGFATCGIIFNLATLFTYNDFSNMLVGAFIGGGALYLIRGIGNMYYGDDSLGLGDVKLLAAAGIWLGIDFILIGITFGALAGLFHGIGVALFVRTFSKVKVQLNKLSIPAGPGFAVGIAITALIKYLNLLPFLALS